MRNDNRPKPAKKIPRGKRKWYFRLRGANRKAVLRQINRLGKTWKFAGNGTARDVRKIKLAKLNEIHFFPLDVPFDRSKFDMLGALDVFILSKWLDNGTTRFDGKHQSLRRVCAFDAPLIKTDDEDKISSYNYVCLERNPEHHSNWSIQVRSRKFILENTLDHPYHSAGLPKT